MNPKSLIRNGLRRLGLEVSRYQGPTPSITELFPQCWHGNGLVFDVFGSLMYQNVTDLVNYAPLKGENLESYAASNSNEAAMIIRKVKPGQNVVDVGANIGLYTLLLSRLVGKTGQVTSFEPGNLSSALLTANLIVNRIENVRLEHKGVTSSSGVAHYYPSDTAESAGTVASFKPVFTNVREPVAIETVTIDDYFANSGRLVDYIKIDIEGGEYEALKGARKTLEANPKIWLTIEFAPYLPLWRDIDLKEFLYFVRSFGFSIFDLTKSPSDAVSDEYLLDTYQKSAEGRYANLLLERR